MRKNEKIRLPFALRRQQSGPDRMVRLGSRDVVGYQPLQEDHAVIALSRDDASFG